MFLKLSERTTFYHTTNKDNFTRMLESGNIKSLGRIGLETPDIPLSVEPGRWRRDRGVMPAREAVQALREAGKHVDSIFLTKGGVLPSYGDYIIEKELKHPKLSNILNLIPDEFTTKRRLSLKSNAKFIVPDEELEAFHAKYPALRRKFKPRSQVDLKSLTRLSGAAQLPRKIVNNLLQKEGAELRAKDIHRRAILGGSTALGTGIPGVKDVDVTIPYASPGRITNARELMLKKFPQLTDSPYNTPGRNKIVLQGQIAGNDVDIVLGPRDRVLAYADSLKAAIDQMTPEQRREIVETKTRLKKAFFFPETRYKKYKKKLDAQLGIAKY
jgi:hypothetical protein